MSSRHSFALVGSFRVPSPQAPYFLPGKRTRRTPSNWLWQRASRARTLRPLPSTQTRHRITKTRRSKRARNCQSLRGLRGEEILVSVPSKSHPVPFLGGRDLTRKVHRLGPRHWAIISTGASSRYGTYRSTAANECAQLTLSSKNAWFTS